MSDLTDFLGGFLQTFAASKQQAQQQAAQDEWRKMQTKKLDMELQLEQKKTEALTRYAQTGDPIDAMMAGMDPQKMAIAKILTQLTQPQQGQPVEAPHGGPTFPGALTGAPQMPGLGGITAADIVRHELVGGSPLSDTVRTVRTIDPKTGRVINAPVTRGGDTLIDKGSPAPEEYEIVDIKTPQGTYKDYMPKRPRMGTPQQAMAGAPAGMGLPKPGQPIVFDNQETINEFFGRGGRQVGPGMKTTPTESDLPVKEEDLPLWVHKDTLTSPWQTDTPTNLNSAGYKRVTSQQRQTIDARNNLYASITNMREMVSKIWGDQATGTLGDRTIGAAGRYTGALMQTNPDATVWQSSIYPSAVEAIRAFGEVGNLSGTEMQGGTKSIPLLTDSREVALKKLERLQGWVDTKLNTMLYGRQQQSSKPSLSPKKAPAKAPARTAAGASTITPENIAFTARKYGISEAEVKRRLGVR